MQNSRVRISTILSICYILYQKRLVLLDLKPRGCLKLRLGPIALQILLWMLSRIPRYTRRGPEKCDSKNAFPEPSKALRCRKTSLERKTKEFWTAMPCLSSLRVMRLDNYKKMNNNDKKLYSIHCNIGGYIYMRGYFPAFIVT